MKHSPPFGHLKIWLPKSVKLPPANVICLAIKAADITLLKGPGKTVWSNLVPAYLRFAPDQRGL